MAAKWPAACLMPFTQGSEKKKKPLGEDATPVLSLTCVTRTKTPKTRGKAAEQAPEGRTWRFTLRWKQDNLFFLKALSFCPGDNNDDKEK